MPFVSLTPSHSSDFCSKIMYSGLTLATQISLVTVFDALTVVCTVYSQHSLEFVVLSLFSQSFDLYLSPPLVCKLYKDRMLACFVLMVFNFRLSYSPTNKTKQNKYKTKQICFSLRHRCHIAIFPVLSSFGGISLGMHPHSLATFDLGSVSHSCVSNSCLWSHNSNMG